MYLAPAAGYANHFDYNQQIKAGQYGSTGKHRFYLSLDGGKTYARMTIQLYAPYNQKVRGLIRMEYALNPTGSRILR